MGGLGPRKICRIGKAEDELIICRYRTVEHEPRLIPLRAVVRGEEANAVRMEEGNRLLSRCRFEGLHQDRVVRNETIGNMDRGPLIRSRLPFADERLEPSKGTSLRKSNLSEERKNTQVATDQHHKRISRQQVL